MRHQSVASCTSPWPGPEQTYNHILAIDWELISRLFGPWTDTLPLSNTGQGGLQSFKSYFLESPLYTNLNRSLGMADASEYWAGSPGPATDELSDPGQVMTSQSFNFLICKQGQSYSAHS